MFLTNETGGSGGESGVDQHIGLISKRVSGVGRGSAIGAIDAKAQFKPSAGVVAGKLGTLQAAVDISTLGIGDIAIVVTAAW